MLLTTADVHAAAQLSSEAPLERPRLNIHGPPGTAHMLASARRFIFRTGMPLTVHEYGMGFDRVETSSPTWTDENIQVWALPASLSALTSEVSSGESDSDMMPNIHSEFELQSSKEIAAQQATRHSVVQDMFNSTWRHDRLMESAFKDVHLPAKIHMRDPITKTLTSFYCTAMSDAPDISPDTMVLVRPPWPGSRWESLPDRKNLPHKAVSYIVRGHTQRGVFDKAKALALHLKPGPNYSKLAAGESVETEEGSIITPDMVLGPAKAGRGVAIVDLPHKSFISDLLSRPEWSDPDIMAGVDSFCWLTSENVLAEPQVQDFIRSMPHIQHVLASPESSPNYLAMESSAASTIRLSCISRDHFPIPVHDNSTVAQSDAQKSVQALSTIPGLYCQPAERGLTIQIEPKYQVQEQDVVLPLNTYKIIQEMPTKAMDLARDASQKASGISLPNELSDDNEPEIVTLGTGSASPSKYRNVSATLLKMPGYGYYLFDCGEDTLGQLRRMYEAEALNEVLCNMRMIWISHLHADHHLGTLSLLQAVKQANKKVKRRQPCALVADEAMIDFVRDMAGKGRSQFTAGSMHHLVCQAGQPLRRKDTKAKLLELDDEYLANTFHIRALLTTWVSHCAGAQAVSVEFMNGFKISYSGDCRPSKNFARIGMDSDVLIHEATFEDGLEGDAIAKKHSTTGEALGVAAQMRAKNVILTHFSQRYQKIPVMSHIKRPDEIQFEEGAEESGPPEPVEDDIAPSNNSPDRTRSSSTARLPSSTRSSSANVLDQMNVCIAFDFMRTRVSQIKDMHKLYPAIEALFEHEHNVDSDAPSQEKAEAINRNKVKSKMDNNGSSGSKTTEKRKSESDGEGKGVKLSKKALKRFQQQQPSRNAEKAYSFPTPRRVATPDTAGSRHVDLQPEVGLGPIMDVTSQAH